MYKALPIDVAIIRGTTADSQGNVSIEHESLLCDQKITAAAAKNSGGIVIAQVMRVAANGSIPSREVAVPGPLVDCVVVVDENDHDELHGMSYEERHNSSFTGELRTPQETIEKMPFNIRKIIARRAFFRLKPNTIVNLGIGLPEGVASVAAEEGMLDYITLSTEPGVFGGLPASGRNFGPAYNATSLLEMNQMFDFYDGGGLDLCFLGAAEISQEGDVNVSRLSADRLIGPGGFIDISQSTRNICFMTTFTAKGLKVVGQDGKLKIESEGQVKKFVSGVFEKTFSGDEAVRRGQTVLYVTERAVFRRSGNSDAIELLEIAPGVDLQRDVLDQMEFAPAFSPKLKEMDPRIFKAETMHAASDFFGSLEEKCIYHDEPHVMYLDLSGITLNTENDVEWLILGLRNILSPHFRAKGPIDMVVNYDGFDIRKGLEDSYSEKVNTLQKEVYKSVKRYTGQAFKRAQLKTQLRMSEWNPDDLFDQFDTNQDGVLSLEELREGFTQNFHIHLTPSHIRHFRRGHSDSTVDRAMFAKGVTAVLVHKY
jgi:propionate CoA-transferase